jgi:transcriptional regulator
MASCPLGTSVYAGRPNAPFRRDDLLALAELLAQYPLATVVATDAGAMPHAHLVPLVLDPTCSFTAAASSSSAAPSLLSTGAAAAAATVSLPRVPLPVASWRLLGHFAKANPHWQRCRDAAARGEQVLVLFNGSDAYISPTWMPEKKSNKGMVVPTWNYESVQLRGTFRQLSGFEKSSSSIDSSNLSSSVAATTRTAAPALDWEHVLRALITSQEGQFAKPWQLDDAPRAYVEAHAANVVTFCIERLEVVGLFKLSQNKPPATVASLRRGLHSVGDAGVLVEEGGTPMRVTQNAAVATAMGRAHL